MGALKGSSTYLRFLVDGEPPANFTSLFEQAVEARRFLPLLPSAPEEESAGWVPIEAPFDDDVPITRDRFHFGDLIALAYREDKISVPKAVVAHRVKKKLEELEQQGERLTKQKISAVELAVMSELRKKVLPKSRVMDVVWDIRRRELRVFGRGPMATERAAACFERTFALRAQLGTWAARAFSLDLSLRARSVLENLAPEHLFDDIIAQPPRELAEEDA